jgi:hypothetical protein
MTTAYTQHNVYIAFMDNINLKLRIYFKSFLTIRFGSFDRLQIKWKDEKNA